MKSLSTYCWLIIGAILQGTAMAVFLFPHDIPSGGAAGLAIIINFILQLPLGTSLWLVNFIFLTIALKYFGYKWTMKTMFSVTITSITISVIEAFFPIESTYFIFDLLLGSIVFGCGVGLLIRNGASSGGLVIPALMIARKKGLRPGKVMFWINMSIFIATAIIIDIKIVFFAIACQFISTRVIDLVYLFQFPVPSPTPFASRKSEK